jgi:hypothetical protein
MPPGEVEPVRVFDTAEAAMIFLAEQPIAAAPTATRMERALPVAATCDSWNCLHGSPRL